MAAMTSGRSGLAVGLALLAAGGATAQDAPPPAAPPGPAAIPPAEPPPVEPGEIVVTAQGRQQRLRDVPISASVISGAALQSGNLRNLEELAQRLPAVKLTPGPASDLLNIRGVGSGLNGGFEQSVATFVDGIYRGRSRSSRAALFDVDRVEVLKGPQTTFFGNNAIAGALNIATRRPMPGGKAAFNASALYAPTDGEFAFEAGVSAPVTDRLGIRVAAKYFGMDGYVKNTLLDEHGPHLRDFVVRGSAAWEPTDRLRTDVRVDYGRFRDGNSFPNEVVGCPPQSPPYPAPRGLCASYLQAAGTRADDRLNQRTASAGSRFALDFVEVAATNSLKVGSHVLTGRTSYYDHDVFNLTQLAPFPLAGTGGRASPFPTFTPEDYHAYSQEIRLQSPAGGTLEYLVGGYVERGRLATELTSGYYFSPFGAGAPGFTAAATPIVLRSTLRQHDRTLSAFASGTWRPAPGLRLNGGLRYSAVRKTAVRDGQIGTGGDNPGDGFVALPDAAQALLRRALGGRGGNFADPKRTDAKLMPSASVQYDLLPTLMAYASYTRGFKAGGFSVTPNPDMFRPENVDAYEVGAKGSLLDGRLSFNIAAYLSDYDDLQESTNVVLPSGAIQSVVGNVAKARSQGVDLGFSARLSSVLTLTADVGYLHARYRSYPGAPCTVLQTLATSPCSQDLSGGRRAYAPDWSGNVGASVALPLGPYRLRIDPSLYFSTRYFQQASADPLTEQSGYAKLDLRAGFGPADGRWEAAVIGKNLTDKDTGSFRNNIPTSPGTTYVLSDRPLSVAFQFSVRM